MITRRNLFQLTGAAGLGSLGSSLLASCGNGSTVPGSGLAMSDVAFGTGDPGLTADAVKGLSVMGGRLLGRLGSSPGNLAVSPYSIGLALAMTVNGARGQTRQQMLDVLGASQVTDLDDAMTALIRHIDGLAGERKNVYGKPGTVTLDTANALFGQNDTAWEAPFLDALKRSFDAGMRMVDYKTDVEGARKQINAWVSARTQDRIPQLISAGVLGTLTRLVLVNALYFKAPWFDQFKKNETRPGAFHLVDGTTKTADLMRHTFEFAHYTENDTWQAVRLPYAGEEVAMTVVLPREGAFDQTWQAVSSGSLDRLLATGSPRAVDLTLPKWTFRSQSLLKPALKSLGMVVPFDSGRADFSGMTLQEQLFISAVVHETWIAVDENGTEAAAATAVAMAGTAAQIPKTMTVDRPFLFVIHDTKYLTPLFAGRVMDPTAS